MAAEVKLEFSMLIARQGAIAEVEVSAEVSVVAELPCAEDAGSPTVGVPAVNTASIYGRPRAAVRFSIRPARSGCASLDIAKNLLGCMEG